LIIGPLQDLLRREQVNDSAREQLELMLRNTLRLHKIVNSLLDFSRLGAGRVNARLQATDLPTLTQDLVTIFRSAAAKANIELTFERKELGRKVYVDREMWEKIVMNLLSNALKYTLQGSIHISLQPNGGM
jgi:signal transduction histidine kinase